MTASVVDETPIYTPVLSIGVGGIAATSSSATLSAKPQRVKTSIVIMKMVKTMAILQGSISVCQLSPDQ